MIANYDVRIVTTQATPTAVVAATTTWQEFPRLWRSLLDEVWALLRDETTTVYKDGHNVMLYRDGVPNVGVGVVVTASFSSDGSSRPRCQRAAPPPQLTAARHNVLVPPTMPSAPGAQPTVTGWRARAGRSTATRIPPPMSCLSTSTGF
jgi:hypothetical protein